jgi:5-methylcytosine-specific restriction endonuclease McrA
MKTTKNVTNCPVLMLNSGFQAVNMHSVQHVIPMMFTDAATALDFYEGGYRPVRWDEWVKLPIRPGDDVIHSSKMSIRVPRVVVCVSYHKIHKKNPKKNLRGIAARDKNTCQYTGRKLQPHEGSIDHVIPRSKGGSDDWENLVYAGKDVNHAKGSRRNEEVGLKLLKNPVAPRSLPASSFLEAAYPEHEIFLKND